VVPALSARSAFAEMAVRRAWLPMLLMQQGEVHFRGVGIDCGKSRMLIGRE
jgi:hypothetical protein